MKSFQIVIALLLLGACRDSAQEKPRPEPATENSLVHWYLSVKPFAEYERLSFSFQYLKADQLGTTYRTVSLEPAEITIPQSGPHRIYVGSVMIEPFPIKGFSLMAGRFRVQRGEEQIPLHLNDFIQVPADLAIPKGDTLSVTLELDLPASVVLDSLGLDWIFPRMRVVTD